MTRVTRQLPQVPKELNHLDHLSSPPDFNGIHVVLFVFSVFSSFMAYHGSVTRVKRRVLLVEQELLTIGVRFAQSLVLYVMFCRSLFVLLPFFFQRSLSFLRFTESDYPFGIFKLFFFIYHCFLPFTVYHWSIYCLSFDLHHWSFYCLSFDLQH